MAFIGNVSYHNLERDPPIAEIYYQKLPFEDLRTSFFTVLQIINGSDWICYMYKIQYEQGEFNF